MTSPIFLNFFTSAISEPPFFAASVMSLNLVIISLQTNNPRVLILSALLGSLALLTRHFGVAVIFTGSFCFHIFPNPHPHSDRPSVSSIRNGSLHGNALILSIYFLYVEPFFMRIIVLAILLNCRENNQISGHYSLAPSLLLSGTPA